MFARKRPLTRPLDPDTASDQEPLSRRRRRSIFPRRSWISTLLSRLSIQKDDPLTWLIGFFVASLLLAGATLVDLDGVSGLEAGSVLQMGGRMVTRDSWSGWTVFTSPLENKTQSTDEMIVRAKGSIHPKLRTVSSPSIKRDKHGLRVVPLAQEKKLSEHPITTLIREVEKKAEQLEAKIGGIKTFEDAVAEYRETFGMDPPRGFRNWYAPLFSNATS
jgi:hypothetical protein